MFLKLNLALILAENGSSIIIMATKTYSLVSNSDHVVKCHLKIVLIQWGPIK